MSVSQAEVERVLCGIARGEKIESYSPCARVWSATDPRHWTVSDVIATVNLGHIRIKPAPAIRAWKAHEAVGRVVRRKVASCWHLIASASDTQLWAPTDSGHPTKPEHMLEGWECLQPDGSVGPCGVVEGNADE